jgi:hypothetical protein
MPAAARPARRRPAQPGRAGAAAPLSGPRRRWRTPGPERRSRPAVSGPPAPASPTSRPVPAGCTPDRPRHRRPRNRGQAGTWRPSRRSACAVLARRAAAPCPGRSCPPAGRRHRPGRRGPVPPPPATGRYRFACRQRCQVGTGAAGQILAWSGWRRRHQHRARTGHYRRTRNRRPQPPSTAPGRRGLPEHCVPAATLWRGASSRRRHLELPTR